MPAESVIDTFVPDDWDGYIGQEETKERLRKYITAAVETVTPLQHTLLVGPPGCGKTTLASIIATELGDPFMELTMPVDTQVLEQIVMSFQGVLFLDEIHRASKRQQEDLLGLLLRGTMTTKAGYEIEAGWLTVIGATTKPAMLDDAISDRFQFKPAFSEYSDSEMEQIIKGMIAKVNDVDLELDDDIITAMSRAANGKPRACRELVLAARAVQISDGKIEAVDPILKQAGVDEDGLDKHAIDYLKMLQRFGGIAGLTKIANAMNLTPGHIQDIEKILFRHGLIDHSERGRRLTVTGNSKASGKSKTYIRKTS